MNVLCTQYNSAVAFYSLNFFTIELGVNFHLLSAMDMVRSCLPDDWSEMDESSVDYKLVTIGEGTNLFDRLKEKVSGEFNLKTGEIVRVQNAYLYGKFLLKKEEYEAKLGKACVTVRELFHDTGAHKISSIVSGNLDWRKAVRVKYGEGVSFSPSPAYANKESSRHNGLDRAMIIADVLVGIEERVHGRLELPSGRYDTIVGNCGQVYVKYYDDEFYPKYIVFYKSKQQTYSSYRW